MNEITQDQTRWKEYERLTRAGEKIAARNLFAELQAELEERRLLREFTESPDEERRRYAYKRLTVDLSLTPIDIVDKARLRKDEGLSAIRPYLRQGPENYHGFLCARLVAIDGASEPTWSAAEEAWRTRPRAALMVEAWLQYDDPADENDAKPPPMGLSCGEVYVTGGVDRAAARFRLGVDGYPLRFTRQAHDILVPRESGASEVVTFPLDAKGVLAGGRSERQYAIWIECRQRGSLIQNVGINLIVEPAVSNPSSGEAIQKKKTTTKRSP